MNKLRNKAQDTKDIELLSTLTENRTYERAKRVVKTIKNKLN